MRNNDTSSFKLLFANTDYLTLHTVMQIAKTFGYRISHVKSSIICNQKKCLEDSRKLHICETRQAKQFLSTIKYNKEEAFTRCILCKTVGDISAADVMYHKNCMTNYIVKLQRDVSEILDDKDDQYYNSIIKELFLQMTATLELDKEGYKIVQTY